MSMRARRGPRRDVGGADEGESRDQLQRCTEVVRRYCASRTRTGADAEDATQAAFVRFLERADDDVRNPEAWLINAASFECRDLHRRRRRAERISATDLHNDTSVDPEMNVTERLLVAELFRRLSSRDRELLTLRYLDDFSISEVAERFGVSQGNARIMIMRARRRANSVLTALEAGGSVAVGVVLAWRGLVRRVRQSAQQARADVMQRLNDAVATVSESIVAPQWAGLVHGIVPAAAVAVLLPLEASGGVTSAAVTAVGPASVQSHAPVVEPVSVQPVGVTGALVHAGTALAGVAPRVASLGAATAPPGRQEDTTFSSMTPSPSYSHDHTVFAAGTMVRGCGAAQCTALFVTHDAGHSWSRLPALGYTGGTILLPASYPADPTVFAVTGLQLQRSDDGGAVFKTVAIGAPSASVVPDSAPGATRILLGGGSLDANQAALVLYDSRTGVVTPGPALPPGVLSVNSVGALPGGGAVVSASMFDATAARLDDSVLLCSAIVCSAVAHVPFHARVAISQNFAADRTVMVVGATGQDALLSRDGGNTYSTTAMPSGHLLSVAPDPAHGGLMLVDLARTSPNGGLVSQLGYVGPSGFAPIAGVGLAAQVSGAYILPDGRLLATPTVPDNGGNFGVVCSLDGGATWRSGC